MKLTLQQQLDVRRHLQDVVVLKSSCEELYDHIVTAMEARPADSKFSMGTVNQLLNEEFSTLIATPEEKRNFRRINNAVGLVLFGIALIVYWLTMEPTVSFWDCGEFIAASFKMEVGHQPGAPLFLMIGRLFSLLAMGDTGKVAYWVNFSAAVASAATIMFLYWTITLLAAKIYREQQVKQNSYNVIAAGVIGALAYTFSDTFWFSAVEAEVYAISALFTAVTFWAILKWEAKTNDRWLLFIAFIVGLSIGVHLLSLLTLPALTLVYYYKKSIKPTFMGAFKAFLAGCLLVGIVQFALIQYFVLAAAKLDLLFVNSMGFSFGSGAIFFVLLVAALLAWGIRYSITHRKYTLNLSLLCSVFLLFGFSAYFMIIIRANAKPTINLSNPDNPFSLYSYLGRTNYGSVPLIYGNTFDAKPIDYRPTGNTYRKGNDKYEVSGQTFQTEYDKNLLFPRTYSDKPAHINFYQRWLDLAPGQTPTLADNLKFFATWQMGVMYWRYFLWNFAGKQNDEQGYGGIENGNWLSGIKKVDALRLGNQQLLPLSVTTNEGHNLFYFLPLLLGIAGIAWMLFKSRNTSLVIATLFFCTGMAIIFYINQDPMQVRERDYAYVGSFYAFSIFIGFGVLLVKDVLKRVLPSNISLAVAALACLLAVPVLMATQGWDDHNRANKYTALDWAKNYLNSCAKDAILFTNADNDTYPLWYAQEVEGIRTDVRVICVQFLSDPSFIDQLKTKVNDSDPLPITMSKDTYKEGVRDYFPYVDYGIKDSVELSDLLAVMTSDSKDDKVEMNDGTMMNFLPSRKLKLTIDAGQLVKTGTISPGQKKFVVPAMEWSFNNKYASKGNLALFDILVHNNWKRPVYFATSVSDDTYIGLDQYLYQEGYAYRLLPLKMGPQQRDKVEQTNSNVMYSNVMHKLDFSGFKKASYLDPESRRVASSTWKMNNTLVSNLIMEGKAPLAQNIMDKSLKELPMRNYSIIDTLNKLYTVQNLYALRKTDTANKMASETSKYIAQELSYVASLEESFQPAYKNTVETGLYVLHNLSVLANENRQAQEGEKLERILDSMLKQFNIRG